MARRNWLEDYLAGRPDEMHTEEPKARAENAAAGANPYPYGGSYWDNQYMTEDELKSIDSARQAAQRGEIPISQAHTLAESTRAKYGYSGGKNGNEFNLFDRPIRTDSIDNTISDVMARMANWDQIMGTDPYQAGIDQTYQAILNRKPFEYDYTTDPAWQAYKKQYTREGRRASEDVLGQYAAMTGGMPSTAAMTAASQAGDYYAAQMTDKIPELYRLAYSMYADDANRQLADLNAIRGLSGDWYGRQQDRYGRLGDLYSMASGERSYADSRADTAWQQAYQERAYNDSRSDQALADAWNAYIKAGDDSQLRALGITPNMDNLLAYSLAAGGRTSPIGSGGSGGGGGSGSGGNGGKSSSDGPVPSWYSDEQRKNKFFADAYDSGLASNFIASNYKAYGYDKVSGLVSEYNKLIKSMGGSLTGLSDSDKANLSSLAEDDGGLYQPTFGFNSSLTPDLVTGGPTAREYMKEYMKWRDYNVAGNGILEQLSRGNVDAAEQQASDIWDYLSPEQKENLRNTLAMYGIEIEG